MLKRKANLSSMGMGASLQLFSTAGRSRFFCPEIENNSVRHRAWQKQKQLLKKEYVHSEVVIEVMEGL